MIPDDCDAKCWSDPVHIWQETGMVYIWSGWTRPVNNERPDAPGVTCDRCHQAKGMYQDTRCSGTKPSGERCTRPFVGVAGFVSDGEDCEVMT